ncbi:PQQ-dependent sugar dehydrogenase [Smaragdicoccus niigatensis]|uniref:PQQ-dependent sugar dehydrogenase n=1 Tax=Smaragdicoccus niigatensis TaxID=359359 RepID=UPI00036B29ED|nr:PQQ-dependent sugar dehydrogenase [Smaragdicoccus niigatensis]
MSFRLARIAAVSAMTAILLTGCARFDDSTTSPFEPPPTQALGGEVGPGTPTTTSKAPRPTGPCIDPDEAVVVSCLDTTGGIVVLPDAGSALVTERRTGRILQVTADRKPVEVAKLNVDATGDGGLTDIALSPHYDEDKLIYAYVTTGSDNRIVRLAPGDEPKPILVGIPKGPDGNAGAIDFAPNGDLIVLTGDSGSPAAAADPNSRAGKVLRITDPQTTGASPSSILMSGVGRAGGLCPDPQGNIWVTDRTETEDRLSKVTSDGTVLNSVWTWPDKPGVAGCAAAADAIVVSLEFAKALAVVRVEASTGTVSTAPSIALQQRYGALHGAATGPDGLIWITTANKTSGTPGPFDDRVIRIPPQSPAGGGSD